MDLATIFQGISTLTGWIVTAIILIVLHKSGVLPLIFQFLKKNGNGNHRIEDLESHAEIANKEMGKIKEHLASMDTKLDIILRHLKL